MIRGLLGGQRLGQRQRRIRRLRQLFDGRLHVFLRRLQSLLGPRVFCLRFRSLGHVERAALRFEHDRRVAQIFLRRLRARLLPLQLPRRVDDLLLQFRQLGRLVLALLLLFLLRLALLLIHALAFAKNFLKRTHLGEVHVARRPTQLPVRPEVVGPQEIRDELIGLCMQFLQLEQVGEVGLHARRRVATQREFQRRRAAQRIGESEVAQTVIILRLREEQHLLQGRHALVAPRGDELKRRALIGQRFEDKLRAEFVRAPVRIDQLQLILLARLQTEILQLHLGLVRDYDQRDNRLILRHQPRRSDGLVQL